MGKGYRDPKRINRFYNDHVDSEGLVGRDIANWKRTVAAPGACLCFTVLAFGVSWIQAQSKDLLPKYVMGPAIIGASCSGLSAIASIIGWVLLKKGDHFHEKNQDVHPDDHKHKSHPAWMYHYVLYIDATASLVLIGAYLYMLLCLILSDEGYCVAYVAATSKTDCQAKGNGGTIVVSMMILVLIGAGLSLLLLSQVVEDAFDYFDHKRERLENGLGLSRATRSATGQRRSRGGGSRNRQQTGGRNDKRRNRDFDTNDNAYNDNNWNEGNDYNNGNGDRGMGSDFSDFDDYDRDGNDFGNGFGRDPPRYRG